MKLLIDREWCLRAAEREGDSEVGAGFELTSAEQLRPFVKRLPWWRRIVDAICSSLTPEKT